MREARLEKYIKDYVYDKTAETVYLRLEDLIRITHVTKKGSITLAILWANVLQHPDNFPPDRHTYSKLYDSPTNGDRLILKAENIIFTVFMASGSLHIEGPFVYDWFTTRFKAILDHYDASFDRTWKFVPSGPSYDVRDEPTRENGAKDPNTEVEDYLLLRTRRHATGTDLDRRMEEHAEGYIQGLGNINLDQPLLRGEELDRELESLSQGALRDGLTYVHKLWLSLLDRWLSAVNTRVYIASAQLDASALRDITDVMLKHRYKGQIEVILTTHACDPDNDLTLEKVKVAALAKYDSEHRTVAEYRVLHRIMIPVKPFSACFVAAVKDGEPQAEVLVTGASLHSRSLRRHNLQSLTFTKMNSERFLREYIDPLSERLVASTY